MGRRPHAGRDKKIIQGQRRDEFFRKMRRRGGTPRMPTQGMTATVDEDLGMGAEAAETEDGPTAAAYDTAVTSSDGAPVAGEEPAESAEASATEEGATETR
jgi:hypothetical protein